MFISTHQLFYADHLPQENNKTDKMLPKKIPVFFSNCAIDFATDDKFKYNYFRNTAASTHSRNTTC